MSKKHYKKRLGVRGVLSQDLVLILHFRGAGTWLTAAAFFTNVADCFTAYITFHDERGERMNDLFSYDIASLRNSKKKQ